MLAYAQICLLKAEYAPCFFLKTSCKCRSISHMDAVLLTSAVTLVERLGRQRSLKHIGRLVRVSILQSVSPSWTEFGSFVKERNRSIGHIYPSTVVLWPA